MVRQLRGVHARRAVTPQRIVDLEASVHRDIYRARIASMEAGGQKTNKLGPGGCGRQARARATGVQVTLLAGTRNRLDLQLRLSLRRGSGNARAVPLCCCCLHDREQGQDNV